MSKKAADPWADVDMAEDEVAADVAAVLSAFDVTPEQVGADVVAGDTVGIEQQAEAGQRDLSEFLASEQERLTETLRLPPGTELGYRDGTTADELPPVTPEERVHAAELLVQAEAPVAPVSADPHAVVGQTVAFPDIEASSRALSRDLTVRFGVPPFSVLRADAGYWQQRKAEWLALGIQSELGRGVPTDIEPTDRPFHQAKATDPVSQAMTKTGIRKGAVATSEGVMDTKWKKRNAKENSRKGADQRSNLTGAAPLPEYADNGTELIAPGTSIFDPVLCELIYRWWLPLDGERLVLDPFAGGSVRGIVAAMLGARYVGLDLSAEQIAANYRQSVTILADVEPERRPVWIPGDSRGIREHIVNRPDWPAGGADLMFSCPPYYDLEVYSDDPADLSRATDYGAFIAAYAAIIKSSLELLAENRFAVWVIGEIRDKAGMQRGLVADTIRIFQSIGAHLYNEAVLVTPTGTLALRAPKAMNATRKLARGHQAVLVFWWGDKAPTAWGDVL